jgi:hypothetical protein
MTITKHNSNNNENVNKSQQSLDSKLSSQFDANNYERIHGSSSSAPNESNKDSKHKLKTPFGEPVVDVVKGMFRPEPGQKNKWWKWWLMLL